MKQKYDPKQTCSECGREIFRGDAKIILARDKFTPEYSMDQLWLAYVMFEKFGKVWDFDKSEWVKR